MSRIGVCRTATRRVTEDDLATSLHPELCKPPVLATARLLRWCEQAVMEGIDGCAVGVECSIRHRAPAVLGATVAVNACCSAVDGPRSPTGRSPVHDATGELLVRRGGPAAVPGPGGSSKRLSARLWPLARQGGRAARE
ncbi:MAG: thioesterase family protein [Mycobacterium sp.]